MILSLCRLYPGYTPETAREAPAWVWRDIWMLQEAGMLGGPMAGGGGAAAVLPEAEPNPLAGLSVALNG